MSRGRKARPAGGRAQGLPPRGATHPRVAGRAAILVAILVVAGALAYGSGLSSPFLFDDQNAIVHNSQIRQLLPISVPLSPPRDTPVAGRPLVNLSFALNYAAGGLSPTGFRSVNLAIHLAVGLVLFGVIRRALVLPRLVDRFGAGATDLAWACALLWTLHPLQTEVVNYLSERTESLMGLCYYLTLYCSLRALPGVIWKGGRTDSRWSTGAVAACAAGMACKESMVTAPVIVLLFDRVFVFDSWRDAIGRRGRLYAGLASAWLVLGALLWTTPRTSAGFGSGVSSWVYLLNQLRMIVRYLELSVWPRSLVLDYGLPQPLVLGDVLPAAAIVVALALVTCAALRYRPMVGFLGAWFFVTLAPTSSIVPISTEVGAERRMYVPLAAVIVLVVVGVHALVRRPRADSVPHADSRRLRSGGAYGAAALAVVGALMVAGIVLRTREYASTLTMSRTIVERWPSGRGHFLLGTELIQAGREAEGIEELRASARDYPGGLYALGTELLGTGALEEGIDALQRFVKALPANPTVVPAREMLGRAYFAQGNLAEAAAQFELLLQAAPQHPAAQEFLGQVRAAQGQLGPGPRVR